MATKTALRRLARRYRFLQQEIKEAEADLAPLVSRVAPRLVALPGMGIETAGQLLITAGDNPTGSDPKHHSRTCARPP
ncbi:hypothetical protein ACFY8C_39795 [Streptomyces flavochromogenes]|uniref:IS110 family transposase n=1 Tax=Streptomyces flavochromogenes TaxID=68199 RepID=A0ABW6Y489_9ACTN|nr:hypothetical protein [Streptomyces flavochromogenes]